MLRPPNAAALDQLIRAVEASDRDLDRALSDVGILPPLDLGPIRHVLGRRGSDIAVSRNDDGHTIIQVVCNTRPSALVHHDGRVQMLSVVAA